MVRLRPIDQQVVVVFGAASGIGRAAALAFAARGARVVVSGRGEADLQALAAEIRAAGGEATALRADVGSFADVRQVAEEAVARYGRLDTWVHTAAITVFAPFTETTPEEFQRVVEINLTGQAYGAMAALPFMGQGGALIHVSSVEARCALPYQSAYAASKHGIRGMLDALRMELRHAGVPVSVTEILPSTINTPLYAKARSKLGVMPVGVGPIYQPQPVADAILYAAEHPTRQLVVGGAGRLLIALKELAPGLVDGALRLVAFRLQRTSEPRGPASPDNFEAHLPGFDRVEGPFGALAFRRSAYTWLQTRPPLGRLALGAALGLAALVGRRLAAPAGGRAAAPREVVQPWS